MWAARYSAASSSRRNCSRLTPGAGSPARYRGATCFSNARLYKSPTVCLTFGSRITKKRQRCMFPPLGAQTPASRILRISSFGTGSGFNRRIDRVVRMISNRSEAWISWHGVLAGAQLVQPRLSDEIAQRKDRLMGPIARICPLPGRPAEVMLRAPIDRSTKEGGASHAKAALCVRLDWIKEAQAAVRQLLEVQPWHT